MDDIFIDYDLYTALTVDLTDFDFTGISKVILTISTGVPEQDDLTFEFTTAAEHAITITPTQSKTIGRFAQYDFDIVTTDSKRYKNGDNGKIVVRKGVGHVSDD